MTGAPRPVTPIGILAATLARARRRLARLPGPEDAVLSVDLERAEALAAGLEPYLERCSTPESPALAALARRTAEFDWSARNGEGGVAVLEQEMLSGGVEGRLLALLVGLIGARRVLEIGTFTGYSALAMAEALPAGGELVACELDAAVAELAAAAFAGSPGGEKITLRVGPAAAALAELAAADEVFDLVFVDADKTEYIDYVRTVLDRGLVRPGGLVCVDNTLLQGEPYLAERPSPNGAAIAAFNEAVAADPGVEQVLLPLRDGLTLIRPLDPDPAPELAADVGA